MFLQCTPAFDQKNSTSCGKNALYLPHITGLKLGNCLMQKRKLTLVIDVHTDKITSSS